MINHLHMMLRKNAFILRDADDNKLVLAEKNKVNLNGWFLPGRDAQNIGDWLSKIVVDHVAAHHGIDLRCTLPYGAKNEDRGIKDAA